MNLTGLHLAIVVFVSAALHGGILVYDLSEQQSVQKKNPPVRIKLSAVKVHSVKQESPKTIEKKQKRVHKKIVKKKPLKKQQQKPKKRTPAKKIKPVVKEVIEPVVESNQHPVVDPQLKADYEQVLVSWLEKHKRYPRVARRRGLEGDAVVRITITRDGELIGFLVSKKSQHEIFNRAVSRMVRYAAPFPQMPDNYPGAELTFYIPVSFTLQN